MSAKPVTEIAFASVKAGSNITDPTTPEGKTLRETIDYALSQPGAQRAYWGTGLEDPTKFAFFLDWDSLEHHLDFIKTEGHGPFVSKIMSLLDGPPVLFHASLDPHPPAKALSKTQSPASELLMVYVDPEASAAAKDKIASNVQALGKALAASSEGPLHWTWGWAVEEVPLPSDPSKNVNAIFAGIGWNSLEHHTTFREHQVFKDNIGLLRGNEGQLHAQLFHYSGNEESRK